MSAASKKKRVDNVPPPRSGRRPTRRELNEAPWRVALWNAQKVLGRLPSGDYVLVATFEREEDAALAVVLANAHRGIK